jgi:hypothetical protein
LALTSPTSGGRSVGIVRWRTKTTELSHVKEVGGRATGQTLPILTNTYVDLAFQLDERNPAHVRDTMPPLSYEIGRSIFKITDYWQGLSEIRMRVHLVAYLTLRNAVPTVQYYTIIET